MNPITLIGTITVVVLSITTHEAAHGFVADRLGDPTARRLGRLTLNPIPHIDLFFTILLPAMLILFGSNIIFGGAKPVPVNISLLRKPRHDWAVVGAAGPIANLLIALLLAALLSLMIHTGLWTRSSSGTEVFVIGIFVNALLAIFNLIPIPPLDGSRVVQYFLPPEALKFYSGMERYGLLIIVAMVFFLPGFQAFLFGAILSAVSVISHIFGIYSDVIYVLQKLLSRS